jgi:hypothetical protein
MAHKLDNYAVLLQQTDLRLQHPDWVQPNGQCPMCDSYEARLIKLLDTEISGQSNGKMIAISDIAILPNANNSPATIFS